MTPAAAKAGGGELEQIQFVVSAFTQVTEPASAHLRGWTGTESARACVCLRIGTLESILSSVKYNAAMSACPSFSSVIVIQVTVCAGVRP